MKKIPTLFVRDEFDRRFVTHQVTPGCEWVLAGEGKATRKYDGTCVMLDDDGRWWARREVKLGKNPPENFLAAHEDPITGHVMGWIPVVDADIYRWWRDAMENYAWLNLQTFEPGTYELCGPKINGDPENFCEHVLVPHAKAEVISIPQPSDIGTISHFVIHSEYEGIVWHHPDGRRAKLKARDFPKQARGY